MDAKTLALCAGAALPDAETFSHPLTEAMIRFEINTPKRQAAFIATVAIESARLTAVEESLYYEDPHRLDDIYAREFQHRAAKAAPYARNPVELGRLLYQGYWGRGLIQLTWLKNYQAAGAALGFNYVMQPGLVREPMHAAMTAGWFWFTHGCNEAADRGDMDDVTERVNGKAKLHLAERKAQYAIALKALTA